MIDFSKLLALQQEQRSLLQHAEKLERELESIFHKLEKLDEKIDTLINSHNETK